MKCAIYPYSDNLYPILENRNSLINDICIDTVIYPRAWSKLIFHKEAMNEVSSGSDFEKLIEECECVIFADITDKDFMYNDILEKAIYSLESGKNVMFCTEIKDNDINSLKNTFDESKMYFNYKSGFKNSVIHKHEDLKCAVLGVGNLYRGLDDVVAAAHLSAEFKSRGIRTATVTTNAIFSLMGFYHFPLEILKNIDDVEQQTSALNEFFKKIEIISRCDIMIVQFPDGLLKYSGDVMDSYGVKVFMLTRAIAIDYFVMVSFLGMRRNENYEQINNIISRRFDLSLDCCLIQDINIDRSFSADHMKIIYTRKGKEKLNSAIETLLENNENRIMAKLDDHDAYKRIVNDFIKHFT